MSLYVDIKKEFPDFKLSVQVENASGVIALLGGSGCGKSLTLKCIAGIEKPDKGLIMINGKTVFDSEKKINIPPQERQVGYLFQNYALFPTMTVWNNISSVVNRSKHERNEITDAMIKKFQLDGVKKLFPRQISGGQQQRVALARILVREPKILMLDEPFSALDTQLKWHMEQEVASVLAGFEGTTILVSHNRDEVYRLSDKVAVMNNGNIDMIDTKENVFDSPKTLVSAIMTGCKNISVAEKINDFSVKAIDWGIVLKTEKIVPDDVKHIGVRAHHFQWISQIQNVDDNEKKHEDFDKTNYFSCEIHSIINEPFENVLIFSFKDGFKKDTGLQISIQKDICGEWNSRGFVLHIPKDKIICLVD